LLPPMSTDTDVIRVARGGSSVRAGSGGQIDDRRHGQAGSTRHQACQQHGHRRTTRTKTGGAYLGLNTKTGMVAP
jgi:hypothetical protein